MSGVILYRSPFWGYLLLLLPFLGLLWYLLLIYRRRLLAQISLPLIALLKRNDRSLLLFLLRTLFLLIAPLTIILALMEPYFADMKRDSSAVNRGFSPVLHEIALLIDTSPSMGVQDLGGRARLDVAREVIELLTATLPSDHYSLTTFDDEVREIVPATRDHLFLRERLRELVPREGRGTDFLALRDGLAKRNSQIPLGKVVTYLLFSDGQESEREGKLDLSLPATSSCRLLAIAAGSKEGGEVPHLKVASKVDLLTLKLFAEEMRGSLYSLENRSTLSVTQAIGEDIRSFSWKGYHATEKPSSSIQEETKANPLLLFVLMGVSGSALLLSLYLPEKKSWTLSLLLFTLHPLSDCFSQEEKDEVVQANILFDRREFDQAEDIYRLLFERVSDARERELLQYDIGTTLLAKKQPVAAVAWFDSLVKSGFPKELEGYLNYNRSLSHFSIARLTEPLEKLPLLESHARAFSWRELSIAKHAMESSFELICTHLKSFCPGDEERAKILLLYDTSQKELLALEENPWSLLQPYETIAQLLDQRAERRIELTEKQVEELFWPIVPPAKEIELWREIARSQLTMSEEERLTAFHSIQDKIFAKEVAMSPKEQREALILLYHLLPSWDSNELFLKLFATLRGADLPEIKTKVAGELLLRRLLSLFEIDLLFASASYPSPFEHLLLKLYGWQKNSISLLSRLFRQGDDWFADQFTLWQKELSEGLSQMALFVLEDQKKSYREGICRKDFWEEMMRKLYEAIDLSKLLEGLFGTGNYSYEGFYKQEKLFILLREMVILDEAKGEKEKSLFKKVQFPSIQGLADQRLIHLFDQAPHRMESLPHSPPQEKKSLHPW